MKRMKLFVAAVLALWIAHWPSMTFAAEAKKPAAKAEAEEPIIEIDPCGRPVGYVNGPRIYVWYDEGAWHVRTHTARNAHRFTGVITVRGGKVTRVFNYQGLEHAGKKKKAPRFRHGERRREKDPVQFHYRRGRRRLRLPSQRRRRHGDV